MKKFINKQIEKFKKQSLLNKILDVVLLVLIILVIIPSTRKELMTYTSKIKMYITSVDEAKEGPQLDGKSSLHFVDEAGNQYTLGDFEDKPVFINYWATWCPPCRAEMPTLEKLYNDYKEDVHFLFITRESFEKSQGYINENGYEMPVYRITSRPSGSLEYQVLPTSLLISHNNQVVFKKKGAVNWHSKKILKIFDNTVNNSQ